MDCSLPGSSDHGIYQQEYWNGLPFPSPGGLDLAMIPGDTVTGSDRIDADDQGTSMIVLA